jgi:hypothetical protein
MFRAPSRRRLVVCRTRSWQISLGFHRWTKRAGGGPNSPVSTYAALQYKWCGAKIKPIFNDVDKLCAHGLGNALNLPKFVW